MNVNIKIMKYRRLLPYIPLIGIFILFFNFSSYYKEFVEDDINNFCYPIYQATVISILGCSCFFY